MPHHKRDWRQYNKKLVNRGNLNLWIPRDSYKLWHAKKSKKNGRPFTYSDDAIKFMLVMRYKFTLSLRELEGFFLSLVPLLNLSKIPSYTQICRRAKKVSVSDELTRKKNITNIVLDTTGLKLFGEGEWCAKKYGGRSRWMKLHLSMDLDTGKLIMVEITDENVHDTAMLDKALSKANKRKGRVLFDGIADSRKCYEMCQKRNKKLLTPPQRRAVYRKEPEYRERNDALKVIKNLGDDELARSIWAKLSGYSRRSVIESQIARWKNLFGGSLKSRCLSRIKNEVQIKGMILNMMQDQLFVT